MFTCTGPSHDLKLLQQQRACKLEQPEAHAYSSAEQYHTPEYLEAHTGQSHYYALVGVHKFRQRYRQGA